MAASDIDNYSPGPSRMKIGYLVNRYPTVSHTFIRREILALEELGFDVYRISVRDTRDELIAPADIDEAQRTRVLLSAPKTSLLGSLLVAAATRPIRFARAIATCWSLARKSQRGLLRHFVYLAEACLLRRWMAKEQVEHIHVHFGTNSTTVALLCQLLGGPSFSFTVHGPEEFDRPDEISLPRKIQDAKFVVAISEFGRSQLQRWCPNEMWDKLHVVRCGVDGEFLNTQLSPPPATRRLVNVGRLSEQKGQLTLIGAAATLVEEGLLDELVIIGDGPLRPQIEREISRTNLSEHVHLRGSMSGEDVRREVSDARALVLPSFAEGLPVVIMEAFALARPVISTYVAGIPELVEPGKSGWLVPAGSAEQLTSAMREALAADSDELFAIGRHGRSQVEVRHNIKCEAAKLAALFDERGFAAHESETDVASLSESKSVPA